VDGVQVERRNGDGAGWVRAVGDLMEAVGLWVQGNTQMLLLVAVAVTVAMVLLRLLIRGGFRRSTRL
jgi:hypothetical protein